VALTWKIFMHPFTATKIRIHLIRGIDRKGFGRACGVAV